MDPSKPAAGTLVSWPSELLQQPLTNARARLLELQRESARTRPAWRLLPRASEVSARLRARVPAGPIGLFAPVEAWGEAVDLEAFVLAALGAERSNDLAYPRMQEGGVMSFHHCLLADTEAHSRLPVREAPLKARPCRPRFVFAPCLAADLEGHRMGRGAGFYDRYLSSHPECEAMGVLHSNFLTPRFPDAWIRPWDQAVAALLTELEFKEIHS
jgi:5,10-methenyltetrahydrofolate synthetase